MSIPNIITLGRIILVPVIVWAIVSSQMEIAFAIFVIAGVSDAVDGFLAKRFNMTSELGALLDPLADKALLVSIYVALGIWGAVPRWIVILVVSREHRDRLRRDCVMVVRQAGRDEAVDGVEAEHGGAGRRSRRWCWPRSDSASSRIPYDLILMGLVTIFTFGSVSSISWSGCGT